jgi:hypothetical protein
MLQKHRVVAGESNRGIWRPSFVKIVNNFNKFNLPGMGAFGKVLVRLTRAM